MVKKFDSNKSRAKRHKRVRGKIFGTPECPRLNVFRSAKHIYAQVIEAKEIFDDLVRLSKPYNTKLSFTDGMIRLENN